jgi:hypothetical protein
MGCLRSAEGQKGSRPKILAAETFNLGYGGYLTAMDVAGKKTAVRTASDLRMVPSRLEASDTFLDSMATETPTMLSRWLMSP